MDETSVVYPSRVTMLDALELDKEIFNVLKLQIKRVCEILPPWILAKHELYLDLILHSIIWKLSVSNFHGTFGQQLLNITYDRKSITSDKCLLLCASNLLSHAYTNDAFCNMSGAIKWIGISAQILSLINLLTFFREGLYPTLSDRLFELTPVCIINKPRKVGYGYMTRELLWHGFIELFGITLSTVNYQYIKMKFRRILFPKKVHDNGRKELSFDFKTSCQICNLKPILPQEIGCGHIFCYYCLQCNRMIDSKFECPTCGYYREQINFVNL